MRCAASGRQYIGSSVNPARRFAQHANKPPQRMRADAAAFHPFRQHFTLEVLAEGLSKWEARDMEMSLIQQHATTGQLVTTKLGERHRRTAQVTTAAALPNTSDTG